MRSKDIKNLIKESDTFLNYARAEKDDFLKSMFIKSSLAFSWFGLEGFINVALSDFLSLKNIKLYEKALINEQRLNFEKGDFIISGTNHYSTEDKLLFILKRFGNYEFQKDSIMFTKFKNLKEWRDSLVHPKEGRSVSIFTIRHASDAVDISKAIISLVYKKVYKKKAFF